jgi:hypothetical protein
MFYNKFIIFLYIFRDCCAYYQEVKLYFTASSIIIHLGGRILHRCAPDDHLQSVAIPDAV